MGAWNLALLLPESQGDPWALLALVSPIWLAQAEKGVVGPPRILPSLAPAPHLSQGGGCALMNRTAKFQQIVRGMNQVRPQPPAPAPTGPGPADRCRPARRCWTCR